MGLTAYCKLQEIVTVYFNPRQTTRNFKIRKGRKIEKSFKNEQIISFLWYNFKQHQVYSWGQGKDERQ